MSQAYLSQYYAARKPSCDPPYPFETEAEAHSAMADQFRALVTHLTGKPPPDRQTAA